MPHINIILIGAILSLMVIIPITIIYLTIKIVIKTQLVKMGERGKCESNKRNHEEYILRTKGR
jgi:hypothetical protein